MNDVARSASATYAVLGPLDVIDCATGDPVALVADPQIRVRPPQAGRAFVHVPFVAHLVDDDLYVWSERRTDYVRFDAGEHQLMVDGIHHGIDPVDLASIPDLTERLDACDLLLDTHAPAIADEATEEAARRSFIAETRKVTRTEITDVLDSGNIPIVPLLPPLTPFVELGLATVSAALRAWLTNSGSNRYTMLSATPLGVHPTMIKRFVDAPAVLLCSHYAWTSDALLDAVLAVKAVSPDTIAIHGGPHVPRHDHELVTFLEHPAVDVAVAGEGEHIIRALFEALDDADWLPGDDLPPALDALPGVTVARDVETVGQGPGAERLVDLGELPSPYLTGELDMNRGLEHVGIIETNRGCPYNCAFCDWGQVTASRIRLRPLDDVFADLDYAVNELGFERLFFADANFGIHKRDVEIAQHIADLNRETGRPSWVRFSFAKNTTKHTARILKIFASVGIQDPSQLSMQTSDQETLDTIGRENIPTELYQELAQSFRDDGVPIGTELMVGLPGATKRAFRADLQLVLDNGIKAAVYKTKVLPNAPMNNPEYRDEHQVMTDDDGWVVSTATCSRREMDEISQIAVTYRLFEGLGLFRWGVRWVAQARDMAEVDVICNLASAVSGDRYPHLRWLTVGGFGRQSRSAVEWELALRELTTWLVEEEGFSADDPALITMIAAHRAIFLRRPTEALPLPHDVVTWAQQYLDLGRERALPIEAFGPAVFTTWFEAKSMGLDRMFEAEPLVSELTGLTAPTIRALADAGGVGTGFAS